MSGSKILQWSASDRCEILNAYGKTVDTVKRDIDEIKVWMGQQLHLPEIPDDRIIENFLILNKFSIEKSKQKLDMYYKIRAIIPEFYDKDPNGSIIQQTMNTVYYIPLPKLADHLLRVVIVKFKDLNAVLDAVNYAAHTLNITEVRLREECCLGDIHICDLGGLKLKNFANFSPSLLRKGNFVIEKVFSSRVQGIHFINAAKFLTSFINLIKSLFTSKLSQRVFVHESMDSLHNLVPKSVLPSDYGGDEKSLEELSNDWKHKFVEYDAVFRHLRGLVVDEKFNRDTQLPAEVFELKESFRQLDFD